HQLPSAGFLAQSSDFLDVSLRGLKDAIGNSGMESLAPGLDWLARHRPPPPAKPSILHMDFHPLNLIRPPDRQVVVIDWTLAELGDPHADVAKTLMLLDCVSVKRQRIWQRLEVAVGRGFLRALFLRACYRLRPLDADLLTYYQALAALNWLVRLRQ